MKRFLAVGWGAVGDTVHAIPAIRALRRSLDPGDEIWLESVLPRRRGMAPHVTVAADLLEPLGLVDRVRHREVPAGRRGMSAIEARLAATMLGRRFDRVFVFMPFRVQPKILRLLARSSALVCLAADPVTGGPPSEDRTLAWHLLNSLRRHGVADVNGDDSATPFLDPPPRAVEQADAWLVQHRRQPDRRLVAVAPDASYPANRWPIERFVAVVRDLQSRGGFEVVLCGAGRAVEVCREIADRCPGALVSAGRLPILATAALFRRCALFVGLDTGTTHLASACGVPYVALYGQRTTGRWYFPPCPDGVVLQRDVPCRRCWLTTCDQPGHPCLAGIGVQDVLEACGR